MAKNTRLKRINEAQMAGENYFPPLSEPSCPLAREMYDTLLAAQPSSVRGMTAVRMLTLELAESHIASNRLNKRIMHEGEVFVDPRTGVPKVSPLVSAQHNRVMQVASITTKLRLIPAEVDKLQGLIEAQMRGHGPLAANVASGDEVDWVEIYEKEISDD